MQINFCQALYWSSCHLIGTIFSDRISCFGNREILSYEGWDNQLTGIAEVDISYIKIRKPQVVALTFRAVPRVPSLENLISAACELTMDFDRIFGSSHIQHCLNSAFVEICIVKAGTFE